MFVRRATLSVVMLVSLLGNVGPARAQLADSPWPMYMHDLQHTGKSGDLGPTTAPVVKWAINVAKMGKSQPAIGPATTDAPHGIVYVGVGSNPLCAFDGYNGDLKWCSGGTADSNSSSPAVGITPQTPASAHTVFLGARDNGLWAFDVDDLDAGFSLAWRFKIPLDGDIMSSPSIAPDGQTIYMTCGCLSAGDVWAMNPDGTVRWMIKVGRPVNNSAVTLSNKTNLQLGLAPGVRRLYVGARDGSLVAINDLGGPNVSVAWTYLPLNKKSNNYNSSPSVDRNGDIYWGSALGFHKVQDLGAAPGTFWSKDLAGTADTTAAIDNDRDQVFVSSYTQGKRTLYAFKFDGTPLWQPLLPLTGKSTATNNHEQSPSPIIDSAGNVYAAIGRQIYAFAPNGTSLWTYSLLAADVISMALGDQTLYFGTEDKVINALTSTP